MAACSAARRYNRQAALSTSLISFLTTVSSSIFLADGINSETGHVGQRAYLAKLDNIQPLVAVVEQQKWQTNGRVDNGGFIMPLPTSTVGKALEAAFPKAVPTGQLSNADAADLMHSIQSHVVSLLDEEQKHMDALKSGGKATEKLRNEIHNKIQAMPKLLEPLKARYTKFTEVAGNDLAAKGYTVKPLPDLPVSPKQSVKESEGNPVMAALPPGTSMPKKKRFLRLLKKWRGRMNPVRLMKKLGRLMRITKKKQPKKEGEKKQ